MARKRARDRDARRTWRNWIKQQSQHLESLTRDNENPQDRVQLLVEEINNLQGYSTHLLRKNEKSCVSCHTLEMHMDYSDPTSGALSPDFLGAGHSSHTLDDFSMDSLGQVVGSDGRSTALTRAQFNNNLKGPLRS